MRKILIAGSDSFIGTNLEAWLKKRPGDYSIDTLDMQNSLWKHADFSQYDALLYVAGIVHHKETKINKALFYKVNRDLTYAVAKKAKAGGVKQFIFLSTMNVYGVESGIIHESSPLHAKSTYGKSKLQAEELLDTLEDHHFKLAIIRPPMVYGRGAKGNYRSLAKLAAKVPVFPDIDNKRSMIYIANLCEFIKQLIDNEDRGVFFPQNSHYVNSSEMVKLIAEAHGRRIWLTQRFNPLLRFMNLKIINKVFGDLGYAMDMSEYKSEYRVYGFRDSVLESEGQEHE